MSYTPSIDFIASLRQTSGGVRSVRMPGLDYVVAALARAGLIALAVSATAPVANQAATAWFRPATPSYSAEGVLFLWNSTTVQYEVATPALWAAFLSAGGSGAAQVTQTITAPGPANVAANANVVLVNQIVGAAINLVVPLASNKIGSVLIADWKGDAGANNITVTLSGADVFPGGSASWKIADNAGSLFLRPVAGVGYAL